MIQTGMVQSQSVTVVDANPRKPASSGLVRGTALREIDSTIQGTTTVKRMIVLPGQRAATAEPTVVSGKRDPGRCWEKMVDCSSRRVRYWRKGRRTAGTSFRWERFDLRQFLYSNYSIPRRGYRRIKHCPGTDVFPTSMTAGCLGRFAGS